MTTVIRRKTGARVVVERDVKPANVMVRTPEEERARVFRMRSRELHGEVVGEFRRLGVVDLEAR